MDADIFADSVMVGGEIVGEIVARRRLEIIGTGRVTGDFRAAAITITEGCQMEGSFRMIGDTSELDVIPFEAEQASSK